MTNEKTDESETTSNVPWGISDVLIVTGVLSLVTVASVKAYFLFDRNVTAFAIIRLISAVMTAATPIVLLRKRYGLKASALGLRKGRIAIGLSVALGVVVAVLYSFVIHAVFLGVGSQAVLKAAFYSPIRYFVLMFAAHGFLTLAAVPFCEEILFRGFFCRYLCNRLGFVLGVATQALVFGFVHSPNIIFGTVDLGSIAQGIVAGLILGILYETTGSIISSAVCHSVVNYYVLLFSILS